MSSPKMNEGPGMPAFFLLQTGKDQYVVKGASSNDFQVGTLDDGAFVFEMTSVPEDSTGLVLLQTLGGFKQVPADPSQGVVLLDGSATQVPFQKVAVDGGFALGTPDRGHWLSVADGGKLVFVKLTTPGASETFTAHTPPLPHGNHYCCGPSLPSAVLPSKALWNADGHKAIVQTGIECLRNPVAATTETLEFIKRWDDDLSFQGQLFIGLPETDEDKPLTDWCVIFPTYASHFYDPDTGRNYFPGPPTALERGRDFFNASLNVLQHAGGSFGLNIGQRTHISWPQTDEPLRVELVSTDREGITQAAARLLGVALHYLTDLSQPMHAANVPNVFNPDGSIFDWRHTKFEDYAETAVRGLLTNYPRLTPEQLDINAIESVDDLYRGLATVGKKAWLTYIRPIFVNKRYLERWGDEAKPGLQNSMYLAPAHVARFLAYWTYLDLKPLWDKYQLGSSYIDAVNDVGQVCICSLTDDPHAIRGAVMPGAPAAQEISTGSDGSMWVISREQREGGFAIYYVAGGAHKWVRLQDPVAATKVAVMPDGTALVVNDIGKMWALTRPDASGNTHGDYLSNAPLAREISIGRDGSVWLISAIERGENFAPYYLAPGAKEWVELKEAAATNIAAAPDGSARAITSYGDVWYVPKPDANGKSFGTKLPNVGREGKLIHIGVGSDGTVWICNYNPKGLRPFQVLYLADGAKEWTYVNETTGAFLPERGFLPRKFAL